MLDEAVAANASAIIVQVAGRQDACYDSEVLPRTPDPAMPAGLDLLAERVLPPPPTRGRQVHARVSVLQAHHEDYDGVSLPADHV